MSLIDRSEQLDSFNKLRNAQSGGVYVLQGSAGVGKSLFLRQCRDLCKKDQTNFLYLDLEKFVPASTAAETLQNFSKSYNNWLSFQDLIKTFKNKFSSSQDILNHYQEPLEQCNVQKSDPLKQSLGLFKLFFIQNKTEENQSIIELNHPEQFMLENLKILCQKHPIIFVDAYEQLYENPRLKSHRLHIVLDFHGEQLIPLNQPEQPLLIDWLDAYLEWLVEQGAVVIMTGRRVGKTWQRHCVELLPLIHTQSLLSIQKYNSMINKENILDIQPISGTYILILESKKTEELKIGNFGKMKVEKGFYIYVGSAFGSGGLQSRIKRQLQPPRKKHWHIDYLREATDLKEAWFSYDQQRRECEWAVALSTLKEYSQPVKGFGSSDCNTCSSHLFYCKTLPNFKNLQTHFHCEPPLQRAIF